MTIQSAIDGELPFLRSEAEGRMLDTVEFRMSLGKQLDPDQGVEVEAFGEPLFPATKARIRVRSAAAAREGDAGDRTTVTVQRELHIPWDHPKVPVGAVAFVTAIGPLTLPSLAGARMRTNGLAEGSQQTACRLQVTEVIA